MLKKQIFILGASGAYGVGGTQGGWSGLIKQFVHSQLYGSNPLGEQVEVYNFAKPGAEIKFVKETIQYQLNNYWKKVPSSVFMSVGLNDTKAVDRPDNYISNKIKFEQDYIALLDALTAKFEKINILGFYELDEMKVYPKINPFDGSKSYFSNQRIFEFNNIMQEVCGRYGNVNFIDLNHLPENWIVSYLFEDGLHPDDNGHQLIFDRLKKYVSN